MKKIFVFALIAVLVALTATVAFAQSTTPPVPAAPPDVLGVVLSVLTGFGQLAGFAALTAIVVNFGKQVGFITDNTAGTWFAGATLLELAFCTLMAFVKPEWSLGFLDTQAGVLAAILTVVLAYITQLISGFATHKMLSNYRIPLLGFSFSKKA